MNKMQVSQKNKVLWGTLVLGFALSGCGVNVKTPKDMKLDLKLNLDDVAQKVDRYLRKKLPFEYYRFLKDPALRRHIHERGKALEAECLVPSKNMVFGEQQGDRYEFILKQACYTFDANANRVVRFDLEIAGSLDTKNFQYHLDLDTENEVIGREVAVDEYLEHVQKKRFLTEDRIEPKGSTVARGESLPPQPAQIELRPE